MARNERRYRLYNRILFAVGMVALALLTLWNLTGKLPAALALEQETRCGIEEHIHTDDCYIGDVLVCGQKAHTHSESCYLILLEDNDVNQLLAAVDNTEGKSLDSVIDTTLVQALDANGVETYASDLSFVGGTEDSGEDASPSPSRPDPTPSPSRSDPSPSPSRLDTSSIQEEETSDVATLALTNLSVTDLNTTIADSNIEPALTLNENLYAVAALSPTDTEAIADDGVSTLAVGGTVGTGAVANFYIWLDETQFVYIGNVTVTNNNSSDYAAKADIANLYNTTEIISGITSSGLETGNNATSGTQIRYTTTQPTSTTAANAFSSNANRVGSGTTSANRINFGDVIQQSWWGGGTTYSPRYATLMTGSGSNTYTPIKFYTVTLDYSQSGASKANEVQYVQSGQDSNLELSDEYLWYLDKEGTQAANADDLTGIDQTTTLYARPKNFTVTYKDGNNNTLKTVTLNPGEEHIVEVPDVGYRWQDGNGNFYTGGESITQTTTLTATLKTYSVTFDSNDGSAIPNQIISHGSLVNQPDDPSRTGYTFGGWYSDESLTSVYNFATPVISDLTLYAKWTLTTYTVTMIDETGATTTETVEHGTEITLPNDLPAGYIWVGEDGNSYVGGATAIITGDVTFTAKDKVTATYLGKTGTSVESKVPGSEFTLPEVSATGNLWVDETGATYAGGATVTLSENMTFTERTTIKVSYDLNFYDSDGLSNLSTSGVTVDDDTPTLTSSDSVTAAEGNSVVLQDVSDQTIKVYLNAVPNRYGAIQFLGWKTENGTLLSPGTHLTWDALSGHDTDSDGTVELTGQWDYHDYSAVNFFIKYNSKPDSSQTAASYYTSVVFATYVGGIDTDATVDALNAAHGITDDTHSNLTYLERGDLIESMYGKKDSGAWLAEYPADESMFGVLRALNQELQVPDPDDPNGTRFLDVDEDGTETPDDPTDDLNSKNYSLRWYQFKLCSEGAPYTWHVDGMLVKKQGQITVDKTFGGTEEAVEEAEVGFYIVAENGTRDSNGVFTPYDSSHEHFKQAVLVLDQTTATALASIYPNAKFLIYDADSSNPTSHNYEWLIESVSLGEYWRVTEYPVNVDGYSYYAEYSVYDTDGNITAVAEYGTVASVVGRTFALDEDPDQGLLVDFRNYYYPEGSILIKKEDADTGQPIGGASFELWQGGTLLTFNYDDVTGQYVRDAEGDGEIKQITTASDGFSIISATNFSYDYGAVTVKEVVAPSGYDAAPNVVLDEDSSGTVVITEMYYENGDSVESSEWGDYAEVPNNDVLVVKDRTTYYASFTVNKVWADIDTPASNVTVALQANGANAATLFPGMTNAQVVLNSENNWTHTWTKLPAYANGELVSWSVKETYVGSEPALDTSGSLFANWTAIYSAVSRSDTDSDGIADTWSATVTNTPRRTQIILIKVDDNGALLPGAEFTLVEAEYTGGTWQAVSGATTLTEISDSAGKLTFDGLTAGKTYLLTETAPPTGYHERLTSIAITVNGDGLIQMVNSDGTTSALSSGDITYVSAYSIQVVNYAFKPLPETGGHGTIGYTLSGILLMAAALLIVYKKSRRREVDLPDV